jgi:predicted ATPase
MATSAVFWRIYFLALLAEVYGKGGKVGEGLAVLVEALRRAADTRMGFYEPEMHRVQGELLLARAPANPADAEACFRQAIASARRQGARSLELRAVLSLSRLYHQQGKEGEVHPILAEIYGWFTEGFDTADLQEAKALLEAIS